MIYPIGFQPFKAMTRFAKEKAPAVNRGLNHSAGG
jgi:hypothetical protein